jgi:hypothetical protein
LLAAAVIAAVAASLPLDEPLVPRPYVVSSSDGAFYFKMSLDPSEPGQLDKAAGYAFKVTAGPQDALLWSTSGWWAERVFLSLDGEHLVRLGNWPSGRNPTTSDLAVAFYASGQLLKSYSTAELIRDTTRVTRSMSHYQYLGEPPPGFVTEPLGVQDTLTFRLVTVDRIEYVFDARTGNILSPKQP